MAFGAFAPMPIRLGGATDEGWSPEQHARVAADLVAAKRAAPLAVWTFTKSGSTITVHSYTGQNGAGLAYAPTGSAGGTGVSAWGWLDARFDDPYGVTQPFSFRHARITCHGTAETNAVYYFNYLNVPLLILTFDSAAAAVDCKATVQVW